MGETLINANPVPVTVRLLLEIDRVEEAATAVIASSENLLLAGRVGLAAGEEPEGADGHSPRHAQDDESGDPVGEGSWHLLRVRPRSCRVADVRGGLQRRKRSALGHGAAPLALQVFADLVLDGVKHPVGVPAFDGERESFAHGPW